MEAETHWTERSADDFLFSIGSDFMEQIRSQMETLSITQSALAEKLGITKGRVSQMFKAPNNVSARMIVRCARAVGLKVAIVAYDDGDSGNQLGPVLSDMFGHSWESAGKPRDAWAITAPASVGAGEVAEELINRADAIATALRIVERNDDDTDWQPTATAELIASGLNALPTIQPVSATPDIWKLVFDVISAQMFSTPRELVKQLEAARAGDWVPPQNSMVSHEEKNVR